MNISNFSKIVHIMNMQGYKMLRWKPWASLLKQDG